MYVCMDLFEVFEYLIWALYIFLYVKASLVPYIYIFSALGLIAHPVVIFD
jgi:hypothetical protein